MLGAREVEPALGLLRLLIYTSVLFFYIRIYCWRRKGIKWWMLGVGVGVMMLDDGNDYDGL